MCLYLDHSLFVDYAFSELEERLVTSGKLGNNFRVPLPKKGSWSVEYAQQEEGACSLTLMELKNNRRRIYATSVYIHVCSWLHDICVPAEYIVAYAKPNE